jgi:hypothetical protein
MRIATLAITGMLAACVAFPAAAAKKRAYQAVSPAHSTCTGLKPQCFSDCGLRGTDPKYCEYRCNFEWKRCMKSGFWEGGFQHRPAERR